MRVVILLPYVAKKMPIQLFSVCFQVWVVKCKMGNLELTFFHGQINFIKVRYLFWAYIYPIATQNTNNTNVGRPLCFFVGTHHPTLPFPRRV